MTRLSFEQKSETFGFDTSNPWSLSAFHLLFNVPRAYEPLVDTWDKFNPGTKKALKKLVDTGWVTYQPSLIVNIITGKRVKGTTKKSTFYSITSAGKRALEAETNGLGLLQHEFPRISLDNLSGVRRLLLKLVVPGGRSDLPAKSLVKASGLADRTGRWWIKKLLEMKWIKETGKFSEAEEIVPAHWRVTRHLCTQLRTVFSAYPNNSSGLIKLFRLNRSSFLDDIPLYGKGRNALLADYQHDINAQIVLSSFMLSKKALPNSIVNLESKIYLPSIFDKSNSYYVFNHKGAGTVYYQPDAEIRELGPDGRIFRGILEYERQQSRKDAWSHIEKFIAYMHLYGSPWEGGILRFIVDSPRRAKIYTELIEAYADYCLDNPQRLPEPPIILAVSCLEWVTNTSDALNDSRWKKVILTSSSRSDTVTREVVLHVGNSSPYFDYFAGGGE